ncbi:prephenate dehydratase [Gilvibacter sp.]|uniref:prephenate dehydratase n=1 Tax=Gilvibacter sp. TaxID=2729997 RepID=UPI003F4A0797
MNEETKTVQDSITHPGAKIAIQGVRGSNHHLAATQWAGPEASVVECETFDSLIAKLVAEEVDFGIMAVENSTAGSILPNYALIDTNDLHVCGEHYLNISHNLLALEGQDISEIKEVHSHYMALLQCKAFFSQHPHIKLVEASDTALAAKEIADGQLKGIAALAPELAASLYSLNVLAPDVQSISKNATRFVMVSKTKVQEPGVAINKASLKFELDHKRGSLATALNVMSDCNLSLTKIQSLPIIETPWRYSFFVDVVFESLADFEKATAMLGIMAKHFKVLGTYNDKKINL